MPGNADHGVRVFVQMMVRAGATVASWDKVYQLDPLNGTDHLLTPAQARNVIGGEVSLWGEEIDQNNLIAKAWPRSAAFGERMWSGNFDIILNHFSCISL